jgi:hypothetical protein
MTTTKRADRPSTPKEQKTQQSLESQTIAPAAPTAQEAHKRVYSKDKTVDHDLYRLELAKVKKNMGLQGTYNRWLDVQHQHFHHTHDSNGKPMDKCSPMAGHFHVITVVKPATADSPAVLKCGPAVKFVKHKTGSGRTKRGIEALRNDNHSHEVSYVRSETIKVRAKNVHAATFMSTGYEAQVEKAASDPEVRGVGGVSDL